MSTFVSIAVLLSGLLAGDLTDAIPTSPDTLSADIVVYGGAPAGIAAAVGAAREGATVILVEPTRHLGGITSAGLTKADINKRDAVGGFFEEYRRGVLAYYQDKYGKDSPQVRDCQLGYEGEPHVCELVLNQLLSRERSSLRVLYQTSLVGVAKKDSHLALITVRDAAAKKDLTLIGREFIDASYEGDLAAKAGVPYRVGRESRKEFGEWLAGKIYIYFGSDKPLSGSTGEADDGIQAYCFRLCMTADPHNQVPVEKPKNYRREDYAPLLADIKAGRVRSIHGKYGAVHFFRKPNGKFEVNNSHVTDAVNQIGPTESSDLAEENWRYPEATPEERQQIVDRYWTYQEGLIWFLQHDPEVPQAIRDDALRYGFAKDEFTDNRNRPYQIYVRQSRRIDGKYKFTQHDGTLEEGAQRTPLHPDAVAIAEYAFDSHSVHKFDGKHAGVREGYFYVPHPPAQIPFRVMVPQNVDNLLVPVCCSATHVGYQTIRMEPVYMVLGQAAGIAAALACQDEVPIERISMRTLQEKIVASGGIITYFSDLHPGDADYAPFAMMGRLGLNPAYMANADQLVTRAQADQALARMARSLAKQKESPKIGLAPDPVDSDKPATTEWLLPRLTHLGWTLPSGEVNEGPLTWRKLARLLDQAESQATKAEKSDG